MSSERAAPSTNLLAGILLTLVHANVLISLSATSVAISTILLAGADLEILPLFIVFAVTMFVYSFNRLTDLEADQLNVPERASFIQRYGCVLFALGVVLYGGAIVLAVVRGIRGAPALLIPATVAVLYSVIGLQRVLLVKNLLVGLSWGLIPLGVGVYYDILWTTDVIFLSIFVTLMLTIAAAVFDIKDIRGDRAAGIRSVPVVLGVVRTRHGAVGASVLLGLGVIALVGVSVLEPRYLVLAPFTLYVAGYSMLARRDRSTLFYGAVIDGEHILLAVAVLVLDALLW